MINFIRGFLFLPRSIYGKPVTAGSVNLTGIEKYTKKCWKAFLQFSQNYKNEKEIY